MGVSGVLWVSRWLSPGFSPRVRKILNLRVFEDESGKHWSKSVMDKQYEVLCVSQFTLQCVLKGNKPDFHLAMPAEQAESFYKGFLEQLRKAYRPELVKGRWGPPGDRGAVSPGHFPAGDQQSADGTFPFQKVHWLYLLLFFLIGV